MLSSIEVWLQKLAFGALGFKKPGKPTQNTPGRFFACFGGVFLVTGLGVTLCLILLVPDYARKFIEYLLAAFESRQLLTLFTTIGMALAVLLVPVSIWCAIIALIVSYSYPDQLTSLELMNQSIRVSFVLFASIAIFVKAGLWLGGKS